MSAPLWTNVQVSMQSAIATAKTITTITKANPGNASSAAHGYANGSYLRILAQGMNEVNNRVLRVANSTTGAFDLDGEDTTNYGAFSSGTAELITFGLTFSTMANVSVSGGESDKVEITTIHDAIKKTRPGMFSAIEFSIDSHWDLSDTALKAAIAASAINAERAFLFAFADGKKFAFTGFVGASGVPTGSTGDIAKTKLTISASGKPTSWLS